MSDRLLYVFWTVCPNNKCFLQQQQQASKLLFGFSKTHIYYSLSSTFSQLKLSCHRSDYMKFVIYNFWYRSKTSFQYDPRVQSKKDTTYTQTTKLIHILGAFLRSVLLSFLISISRNSKFPIKMSSALLNNNKRWKKLEIFRKLLIKMSMRNRYIIIES